MSRIFFSAILLTVGAVACSGTSPTEENAQASEQASSSAPVPVCANTGGGCKADADCCVGTCTYDSYGPTPRHCYAPEANGAYCTSDRGCTSGHCDEYECKAAPTPVAPLGAGCATSADCCSSTFCDTSTYGPWKCVAKRAVGGWCMDATECQSGSCVSYVCE